MTHSNTAHTAHTERQHHAIRSRSLNLDLDSRPGPNVLGHGPLAEANTMKTVDVRIHKFGSSWSYQFEHEGMTYSDGSKKVLLDGARQFDYTHFKLDDVTEKITKVQ